MAIDLGGRFYPLHIRKLAQSRSIAVSADVVKREVRVTMPRYAGTAQAMRFAHSKADWLIEQFENALPAVPITNGATIALEGVEHIIRWSPEYPRQPEKRDGEIRVGGPEDLIGDRLIRWMKSLARDIYVDDLKFYCDRAGVAPPTLSVGDARRRWGSCSGGRSIRLSWRLIMAQPLVRRSVVAHEVSHLRHMNHSPAFYGLLDEIFEGDRKKADRWLKRHGSALHLVGASVGE